jgi:hypothetical protein
MYIIENYESFKQYIAYQGGQYCWVSNIKQAYVFMDSKVVTDVAWEVGGRAVPKCVY